GRGRRLLGGREARGRGLKDGRPAGSLESNPRGDPWRVTLRLLLPSRSRSRGRRAGARAVGARPVRGADLHRPRGRDRDRRRLGRLEVPLLAGAQGVALLAGLPRLGRAASFLLDGRFRARASRREAELDQLFRLSSKDTDEPGPKVGQKTPVPLGP